MNDNTGLPPGIDNDLRRLTQLDRSQQFQARVRAVAAATRQEAPGIPTHAEFMRIAGGFCAAVALAAAVVAAVAVPRFEDSGIDVLDQMIPNSALLVIGVSAPTGASK